MLKKVLFGRIKLTNNICVPKPVKRALENAKKKKYSTVNNIDMVWLLAPNPIDLPFPNKKLLNK
jgi:hypothetical protein